MNYGQRAACGGGPVHFVQPRGGRVGGKDMYKNVWIGIIGATAVATLAACGVPGERPEAIREAAELHGELTVAGCLQHDVQTGRVVLTNATLPQKRAGIPVREGTEQPPVPDVAPSTMGTVPPALAGPRYVVQPPADLNLQAYSNVQVQVTGTLAPDHDAERPVGTTGTDAPMRADDRAADRDVDGHIMAEEIRLVANTCL
jgi:hypothetical protein